MVIVVSFVMWCIQHQGLYPHQILALSSISIKCALQDVLYCLLWIIPLVNGGLVQLSLFCMLCCCYPEKKIKQKDFEYLSVYMYVYVYIYIKVILHLFVMIIIVIMKINFHQHQSSSWSCFCPNYLDLWLTVLSFINFLIRGRLKC